MKREAFLLPPGIYLDGNSLGPLTYAAQAAVQRRLSEWQHQGVSAWEEWFELAERLSPALAKLAGAAPQEVIATGSTTGNLHSLAATFHRPVGARRHILATELDFPSDLYALRAHAERQGAELRLVASRDGHLLDPGDVRAALKPDVALAVLPTVLYRSGQLLDVGAITRQAHNAGITIGWDAAHSIGAVPHHFHDEGADFAFWCSYKYLNAGPGAPGGLFVHERNFGLRPALPGWWGGDKNRQFAMLPEFNPAPGAGAYQTGTPSILALAGLEGALTLFEDTAIEALRVRSLQLTGLLISLADAHLPEMTLRTPRAPAGRGGHVTLEHPDAGLISLALRRRRIIADFRPPDLLRLAPAALYNTEEELAETVAALRDLLDTSAYHGVQERFRVT